jgi:FAD/FMN-containing dehydrogenase
MRDPLPESHPAYVLVEISDNADPAAAAATLEEGLGSAVEAGLVLDAVIAASDASGLALWGLRENISEAQKIEGVSVKHDVSVPVSSVPDLYERAGKALAERFRTSAWSPSATWATATSTTTARSRSAGPRRTSSATAPR